MHSCVFLTFELPMRKVGSLNLSRVKPMTYVINTCQYLAWNLYYDLISHSVALSWHRYALSWQTVPCPILMLLSTWLESEKCIFGRDWFDSTGVGIPGFELDGLPNREADALLVRPSDLLYESIRCSMSHLFMMVVLVLLLTTGSLPTVAHRARRPKR